MIRFKGFPYPIVGNPKGLIASDSGINQIKSDLLILLLTNPGERVMLPDFGTPLKKFLFEQNDTILIEQVRQTIINSIDRWEPRITVNQLEVTTTNINGSLNTQDNLEEIGNLLMIRIVFVDPQNIKEVDELVLQLPLSR